jgi:transcriptional regulator with XRE-family HTH domain
MPKSLNRRENQVLLELLRAKRLEAGLTQAELSQRLQRVQSFISDVERGERRLDLVQLRDLAHAVGTDLVRLVKDFELALTTSGPRRLSRR